MASTRTASRFRAPRSHAASASTQRHDPTPRCASFPQRHGRIHEEPTHAPAASFAAWVGSEGSAATALERALSEYGGGRGAALPEFVGEGGGEGIFCVPLRAVMLLGRPPALEVRPHTLRETQVIPGVPKIKDDYNPSTWMLEVTSISMEKQLGVNFVAIYRESTTYKDNDEMVKQLSIPSSGTSDLHFKAQFPQTFMEQFKACLWKQFLSHWRTPSYNLVRIVFIALSCLMFGALYWQKGNIDNINNQQGLFTVLGCMYCTTLYTGIKNSQSVMPFVSIERSVMYRERFSGMYSPWAYSFAQLAMEIPFVLVQLLIFMLIAYPMIGYEWTITKVLWFSYSMFCTMLYFVYLGMMVVSLTPNMQMATILASLCYTILNLMSGFIVPGPQVPKWWIWLYRISPMPWTLNLFFTTQLYGDDKYITVFGEAKSISKFSKDYFGFHHALVPQTAVMLAVFPVLFGLVFAFSISKLNFQRR